LSQHYYVICVCLNIVTLFVSWLVKKLNSQIWIAFFCCSLYHGGPPQKKKIWGNICVLLLLIVFKVSWFFPECLENDWVSGWLIGCTNWQLKAKQDIILLFDIILYLLQWCYWSCVITFPYINISTGSWQQKSNLHITLLSYKRSNDIKCYIKFYQ